MTEKDIKRSIRHLEEYVSDDQIYTDYKADPDNKELSDFDLFCVDHCKDVETLIAAYNELKTRADAYQEAMFLVKQKKNNDKARYRRKAKDLKHRITEALVIIDEGINSCTAEAEGTVNNEKCWMAVNRLKSIRSKLVK